MTNFAQPVSMPCTEPEYNRDLKHGLQELGYETELPFTWIGCKYFTTSRKKDGLMYPNQTEGTGTYFIPEYNPELFLAIAGMREGEEVHAGEWVVSVEKTFTNGINYEKDELVKVMEVGTRIPEVDHKGHFGFYLNETYFRKATLSELINHFKKEKMEKEHSFKFGDKVLYTEILGQDDPAIEGYFVAHAGGVLPFIVVDTIEQFEMFRDTGQDSYLTAAETCIPFPEPLKTTRSEIVEWKGTDNFEIV